MNSSFRPLALAVGVAGLSAAANVDAQPFSGSYPSLGDAAWERTFSEQSAGNYGRIVEHGFTADFAPPAPPPPPGP